MSEPVGISTPAYRNHQNNNNNLPIHIMTSSHQPPQSSLLTSYQRGSYQKGSIHAILVANPSKRLYIHPLAWQKEHLEYLSCELGQIPLFSTTKQKELLDHDAENHGLRWNDKARGIAEHIQRCEERKPRDQRMRTSFTVLSEAATESYPRNAYLVFEYNRRRVVNLGRPPLVFCDSRSTQNSAWAYVDKTWSSELRHRYFWKCRKGTVLHAAIQAVFNKAKETLIDPLYVAIMIALAQRLKGLNPQYDPKTPQKISIFIPEHNAVSTCSVDTPDASSYTPPVWCTSLKQYTTIITDEYLQKLEDPCNFHDGSLQIHQTSFPIEFPSAIFQAIREASGTLTLPLAISNTSKKRKVSGDITTGQANKVQRTNAVEGPDLGEI